jgi:hypothetical protein
MLEVNTTGDAGAPLLKTPPADEWLTSGRFGVFLALLVAATFPGVLLGSTTFIVRDFGMFSYPVAYFHRESFWHGELPLWNPYSNCGVPFLAQWNTLTLYPASLIYLVLPLSWSLSFFCLVHLFWGGLGMFLLAGRWTNQRLGAAVAGVIFSFNGLSLNFLMWPSHIATFSWLPWVIWLAQVGWRKGGKDIVWAALAGSMQMLGGGPETIVVTWTIVFLVACGDWFDRGGPRGKIFLRLAGMILLVALLSAAQLLPFLELLAYSQRDTGYSASTHDWSMPLWGWLNLLVPLFRTAPTSQGVYFQPGQYWTSSYYAGIGAILLAIVAVRRVRDWRVWSATGLVLLGLILALGDHTLLYRGLRLCFPGLGFVRYPIKFVIPVLALIPVLAAFGLTALDNESRPPGRFEIAAAALILLCVGAIVAVDSKAGTPENAWRATWHSGLSRAVFLVLIFMLILILPRLAGRRRMLFGCLLPALFWLDCVTHMPTQNPSVSPSVYAPGWARAQLKLIPEPKAGDSRAMLSPATREFLRYNPMPGLEETYLRNRLAIRANCNLLDDLSEIDGFFSLVPREIFRVTALPYDHTDRRFQGLLDFMAVSQVTAEGKTLDWTNRSSAMPLVTAGQQPVFADDLAAFEAFSRTNVDLRQIVLLPPDVREKISATRQTKAQVTRATFANRNVSIQSEAPASALLVISQTYYPAWKGYVDGQPTKIRRANYAFQALEIPAGRHEVRLVYEDGVLVLGVVLSGIGLLVCAGVLWLDRLRSRPG